MRLREVDVQALDAARSSRSIGVERMARFEAVADAAQASLAGHVVLNVRLIRDWWWGGGDAADASGLRPRGGIDARWPVIEGDAEFFAITKRIHNGLYGFPGTTACLGRLSEAITSVFCGETLTNCSPWSGPATWR